MLNLWGSSGWVAKSVASPPKTWRHEAVLARNEYTLQECCHLGQKVVLPFKLFFTGRITDSNLRQTKISTMDANWRVVENQEQINVHNAWCCAQIRNRSSCPPPPVSATDLVYVKKKRFITDNNAKVTNQANKVFHKNNYSILWAEFNYLPQTSLTVVPNLTRKNRLFPFWSQTDCGDDISCKRLTTA